jgi:hypothetical protein
MLVRPKRHQQVALKLPILNDGEKMRFIENLLNEEPIQIFTINTLARN